MTKELVEPADELTMEGVHLPDRIGWRFKRTIQYRSRIMDYYKPKSLVTILKRQKMHVYFKEVLLEI